jgi:cyanophycin synthetase
MDLEHKYNFGLTVEESTGFCARIEKNGNYHFVIGADLGLNSSASQRISADKSFTDYFLKKDGINTIQTHLVKQEEELESINIPYPLILKPNDSQSGNGIILVRNKDEATSVFNYVKQFSNIVLAQEYIEKREFRLVVFDHNLYFAYERIPFIINGDGAKSISEFIDDKNRPLKDVQKIDKSDFRILFNLNNINIDINYIPKQGEKVVLFNNANLKCGGTWQDVTKLVNNKYIDIAIRCANSIGLRVAGIDLFANSIETYDDDYKIIEVNSRPGFEYIKENENMMKVFFDKLMNTIDAELLNK